MKEKITAAVFCSLVLAGSLGIMLGRDRYYSETEKRELAQKPSVSIGSLLSGELSDGLEKYLADQFPLRDSWVAAKTLSEVTFGKREANGVYFADDGYIIEAFKGYDTKQAAANIRTLCAFSEKLKKQGIKVRVMLIQTQAQVLSEKLPAYAPNADQQKIIDFARQQGLETVDVSSALSAHRDEYIYYRTDHHFTSLGAYYCYKAYCESVGRHCDELSAWKSEVLAEDFKGATYNKVNYPFAEADTITAYYKDLNRTVTYNGTYTTDTVYERKFLKGADKYAVFFNSNQAQTVVSGSGEGRLLIVKDSYANTLAQFAVDDYEQTHMIDPRFFRGSISDYAEKNGITEIMVCYNVPNFVKDQSVRVIR